MRARSPGALQGWRARRPLLLGVALALVCMALAWVDVRAHTGSWLALAALASAVYLGGVWTTVRSSPPETTHLWACLALAAVCRVPLVSAPPTLSDDLYRYIWDGRVQGAGLSPYASAPADPALAWLHTPDTRLTNHPQLPTIYPPAAQWFFRGVTSIRESVVAFKLAFVACDALVVLMLLRWLERAGRSRWWVLAYAWNPLVILEVAGSAHVDVLGAMLLFASFLALGAGRTLLASLAFVTAVGVKLLPIVLVPFFWRRVRLRDALLAGLFALALAWPFLGGPVGSLPVYLANWRFNGPAFALAERLAPERALGGGLPGSLRPLLLALPPVVGLAVASALRTRIASPSAWAWPLAATLLLMPAVFPWYLLWLTPFLLSIQSLPLLVWTQSVLLTYGAWRTFPASGRYRAPWWAVAVEYGCVLAACLWLAWRRRSPRRAAA